MKSILYIISCLLFLNCQKKVDTTLSHSNTKKVYKEAKKLNQQKLKYQFSFSVIEKDENSKPSKLKINIKQNDKIVQEILYTPNFWLNSTYNAINYFDTNLPLQEGIENFHNFITADFNFDGLEDFAILFDSGGNGGPSYSYYFQNDNGKFSEVENFPLNEAYFPKKIDSKNKTLTISNPVGCCKMAKTIFQLKNSKWIITYSETEDMIK